MKKYVSGFILRGLTSMGFGPIILAIIYWILGLTGTVTSLTVGEVALGILTVSLMAFIAAGINVVYQIEKLPLFYAILTHGIVLYLDYIIIYLINGWIKDGIAPLLIFTASFAVGFALIWLIIYVSTKKRTEKLNAMLNGKR